MGTWSAWVQPGPSTPSRALSKSSFLAIKPRSGDQSPTADELAQEAERRGVEVHVLAPGEDPAGVAARAVAGGADAIGVAGGDGSLGPVSGVAPDHSIRFGLSPREQSDLGERESLEEGLLHAYVVEAVSRRRLLALLLRAALGRAQQAEGLVALQARHFTLGGERPQVHAAVDGELALLGSPVELELRPRALRVLLPASS